MRNNRFFKSFSIGLISIWLCIFALLPFVLILAASFLTPGDETFFIWRLTLHNYVDLLNPIYVQIFLRSIYLAFVTTLFCLILGYPFAYILVKMQKKTRLILLFLVLVPFWTSSLIRTYAIVSLLKTHGIINCFLLWLGIIHQPLQLLYTPFAVFSGLIYCLLPFMILPLYANLEKFDWRLVEAARDLGASKFVTFRRIIIPLSLPGIISGVMLVFLPAMTIFYIPDILGGAKSLLLGNLIEIQFLEANNWPLGSAVSVMLTVIMGLMILVYWKFTNNKQRRDMI